MTDKQEALMQAEISYQKEEGTDKAEIPMSEDTYIELQAQDHSDRMEDLADDFNCAGHDY